MRGQFKLLVLWAFLALIMVILGLIIGEMVGFGLFGPFMMLGILILITIIIYFSSDGVLLRHYKTKRVSQIPNISAKTVDDLAKKFGIPTPTLFVSEKLIPTVFSIGRNPKHASIVFSDSLFNWLDEEEMGAVLAHEMHHIKNKDTSIASIIATVSGALSALSTMAMWASIFMGFGQEDDPAPNIVKFYVNSLVAPPAAFLVQLVSSQSREYMADEQSANVYGKPHKLISALNKVNLMLNSKSYDVNPSHVHLFILSPPHTNNLELLGFNLPTYNVLFKTHPPIDERLRRLGHLNVKSLREKL